MSNNSVYISGIEYRRAHIGYEGDGSPIYRLFAPCGCFAEGDGSNRNPCWEHERQQDLVLALAEAEDFVRDHFEVIAV